MEGLVMSAASSRLPDPQFWRGKRVLLTGHTGFKGSWLALWLQSLGAELWGLALPAPTQPSLFEYAGVAKGMHSCIEDIRDAQRVLALVKQCRPELVIHMAAQPLVRYSYEHPVETYATNVMGTVHLLEAVRQVGSVRSVVNVTTDKCYENHEWVWGYRENEPMGGHDPYSSSKACAELVSSAYRRSFLDDQSIGLATARAGNVIGGGDWAQDRLLPDILRAIDASQPVIVRNPHAIRPWQHVLEPLSGYLVLAESLWADRQQYAGPWNFGPSESDAQPVAWVAERVCQSWGQGASWTREQQLQKHPHEAHYLKLDISKARQTLGWSPRWNLAKALDKTVEWHRAWRSGVDGHALTLKQIHEYTSLA